MLDRVSDDSWRPFGFSAEDAEQYEVLVPGIPSWLLEPVVGWVSGLLTNGTWAYQEHLANAQMVTRIELGFKAGAELHVTTLQAHLRGVGGEKLLRLADYLLAQTASDSAPRRRLESVLAAGRSKWQVGERMGKPGLIERIPLGVQDSVEGVIKASGSAGRILARAWSHVHGLEPNDSGAYADAVRAVETAAIAVVQPSHGTATLGTVIGQMRADGDWRPPLRKPKDFDSAQLLLNLLQTLWHGHRDRHGSVDYSDVTHAEARSAVTLAATLVDWFASAAIARRTPD